MLSLGYITFVQNEVILLNWNWQGLSKNLIAYNRMGVSLNGHISPNKTSAKLRLSSYLFFFKKDTVG